MSDSELTQFEPESNPDFGGPFRTICDHFQDAIKTVNINWKEKTLTFQVQSEHVDLDVKVRVSDDDETLQFWITLPLRVSNEKMRPLAAEYLCRAQWGLVVGAFEFDFRDGQVDFHIAHVMENQTITEETIIRLFRTGLRMFDRYTPGLMQVVFGGNTPSDAVYLAELDMHSDDVIDEPTPSVTPKKKKSSVRRKKSTRKNAGQESPQDHSSHSDSGNQAVLGSPDPQETTGNNQSQDRGTTSADSEEDEF